MFATRNADRLEKLARLVLTVSGDTRRPLYHRFTTRPLAEGEHSLLDLLRADRWDEDRILAQLRHARTLTTQRQGRQGKELIDSYTALPYHIDMEEALVFEWDEAKADANYRKHRVTFQVAARAFDDHHGLDLVDDRMDYGEERWLRIALVEGRVLSVTYTRRAGAVRIVSARTSTRRERRMYHG